MQRICIFDHVRILYVDISGFDEGMDKRACIKKEGRRLETVSLILQLRGCTVDPPLSPLLQDSMQEQERMKIARSHHLPHLDRNG